MADQDSTTQAEATEEQAPLKVTVEEAGPARKKLTIIVPAERITAKLAESMTHLHHEAQIPGFRKGRAPKRLIERRFGQNVRDEVRSDLITESYTEAVDGQELDVLGQPEIPNIEDIKLPEDGGEMTIVVEVEVRPEFELPSLEDIEVSRQSGELSDEDLNAELNRLAERYGRMTSIDDAKAKEGDYLQADVKIFAGENNTGSDDEKPIADLQGQNILVPGESRDHKGHVAGIVVDDLGKQLDGKAVGDQLTISRTGPSGHEDDAIRDKPITIVVTIRSIHRLEPAPVSELVESFGMESEEQLREELKKSVEARLDREHKEAMRAQVREYLLKNVDLELPAGMTGRQTRRILQQRAMQLAYQGVPERDIEQRIAEARGNSEEEARTQLKSGFILDKAANQLEIEVDDNELWGMVAMMAQQQGRRPEKLREQLQRRGEMDQLYLYLREQKTLDKILESAKVNVEEGAAADDDAKKE